jgi:hypothetical protein
MLYALKNRNGSKRVAKSDNSASTRATTPFHLLTLVMKLPIPSKIRLSNGGSEYGTNWRSDNAIYTEKS